MGWDGRKTSKDIWGTIHLDVSGYQKSIKKSWTFDGMSILMRHGSPLFSKCVSIIGHVFRWLGWAASPLFSIAFTGGVGVENQLEISGNQSPTPTIENN